MKHDKIVIHLWDTRKRNLYRGRTILISGKIEKIFSQNREPHLILSNIRASSMIPKPTTFDYFWESLRLQLANRAHFYLSEKSIQLYLPLILGIKSYGPTYSLFKNLGLSHLLVVSGLHAGLFFFGVRYVVVLVSRWFPNFLTSPFRKWGQDSFSFFILLTYITLLGFPAPALRATVGIGVFLLTKHAGSFCESFTCSCHDCSMFFIMEPSMDC